MEPAQKNFERRTSNVELFYTPRALMNLPAPALVEPRLVAAAGAAIVAGLLFLLYANRRRAYVLIWTAGWLLVAGAVLASGHADEPRFAGLYLSASVLSAAAFAVSASAVEGPLAWSLRHWLGAALLGGWLAIGTPALGVTGAIVPGYLAAATALGAACARYAVIARRESFTGAGLMAVGFGIIAGAHLGTLAAFATGDSSMTGVLMGVTFVAYAVAALGMHLLTFEDTTKELRDANQRLETAREELRDLALTDALTGAYNRRFFDEIITRELERHRRANEPLSVVFIDINRFKVVNDVHGHAVGDALLRDVCEFLKRTLRETDYVFRWGGDEFVVLMSCPAIDAEKRMATLKIEYEAAPLIVALGGGAGLAIGCAEAPPGTKDIEEIIARADAAMYQRKLARAT